MVSISTDNSPVFSSTPRRRSNTSQISDLPNVSGPKSLWALKLQRNRRLFRPHSWTGVLQKLIPRRQAPPPPPHQSAKPQPPASTESPPSPLYAEINKSRPVVRPDSPTYYLAGSCDSQPLSEQHWFDNPG